MSKKIYFIFPLVLLAYSIGSLQAGPLHEAAENGDIAAVKRLIRKGAKVNDKDKDGETPLYLAASYGNFSIAKLLIAKGAKEAVYNFTPLHWAAQKGDIEKTTIAIESKFLEPINFSSKEFQKSYKSNIVDTKSDPRNNTKWGQILKELIDKYKVDQPVTEYEHLDVVQLIKHSLGILHSKFEENEKREWYLCYLYWEPEDVSRMHGNALKIKKIFEKHREEIKNFSERVKGEHALHFFSLSYLELWKQWEKKFPEHVTNLRKRYSINAA